MYPTQPESLTPVTVSATGRQEILNCPSTTTGTVFVKSTSSLAFTVQGTMVRNSTTAADWFYIGVTKQDGTTVAAGSTITPAAGDVYTFDVSRCVQFTINVSAGTGTVSLMAKGTGGAGGGSGSGGSGTGASTAFSVFGETGVASGASPSLADETVATATTATAFSSVASFSAYPGRSGVIVTNPGTGYNIYVQPCGTSSTPTVSSTAFTDIVPPGTAKFFPWGYLVRIRWAHDSASTVGCRFTECY